VDGYVSGLMRWGLGANTLGWMSVELAVPLVPWLRERHWLALDVLAATGLLVVLTVGVVGRTPVVVVPEWMIIVLCVVTAAPIAVRRMWPVPVFAVVLSANTVLAALAVGGNPAVVVALAGYTVAVRRPPGRSAVLLALAVVISVAAEAVAVLVERMRPEWVATATLIFASVLVLVAAWTMAVAVRARRLYATRSAEQLAERAVTAERLRIARELHDVITHGVTLITVKASVASYLTDSRPGDVRAALDVIETTGRSTLVEMRRMLGVLRSDDTVKTTDQWGPAPGLSDIPTLIERTTDAGVTVDLHVHLGDRELPEAVSLTVYRIVQEALTNVIKHAAPTHCRIRVDTTGTGVLIDITDDGNRRSDTTRGHGIAGMRERATLFGGQLHAGPLPHHGFRVTARLPLTEVDA
jgi:signal transduction histidine kinase